MLNADRLIKLRKQRGLFQRDIADQFGIERTTYGKYENAGIQPSPDLIVKLADFFDVTTDYLLGKSDIPNHDTIPTTSITAEEAIIAEVGCDDDRYLLFRGVSRMTQDERKKAREILRIAFSSYDEK